MKFWIPLTACVFWACTSAPPVPPQIKAPEKPLYVEKQIQVPLPQTTKILYGDGMISARVETTYDENGRLKKEETFNASGALTESKVGILEGGKLKINALNGLGDLQSYRILTFGPRGRIEKEEFYNNRNQLQSVQLTTYNEVDQILTWTTQDGQGTVQGNTSYSYKEGKLESIKATDGTGATISLFEMIYNKSGLLETKKETQGNGTAAGSVTYKYNDKGQIILEEVRSASGGIIRAQAYTYGQESAPSKITVMDKMGTTIEIREITYRLVPKTIIERG